jgi:alcohol dehydrogenase
VLVIGAGPIGLSVVEFAKLGGSRVVVMDLLEQRLKFVREKMGVQETFLSRGLLEEDLKKFADLTGGKLGNVVVDATGSAKSMNAAYNFVGFAGRLVWVGITQDELRFTQPLMHRREMTFMASRNALAHEFTRIIQLIEEGKLDTRPWVTHRAPFAAMIDVFPNWLKPETGVVKAMVEVS